MKAKSKLVAKAFYYQKYLGLFLILIGIPILMTDLSPNSEFPLMIGLFTVFTSMEKGRRRAVGEHKNVFAVYCFYFRLCDKSFNYQFIHSPMDPLSPGSDQSFCYTRFHNSGLHLLYAYACL